MGEYGILTLLLDIFLSKFRDHPDANRLKIGRDIPLFVVEVITLCSGQGYMLLLCSSQSSSSIKKYPK